MGSRGRQSRYSAEQIREAVTQYGSQAAAAKALGIAASAICTAMKAIPPSMDRASGGGDVCEVERTTNHRVRTLADLIRVCEIDTQEWTVERWVCNKWDSAAKLGKDDSERIAVTELYQVKVWLKRNVVIADAKAALDAVIAEAKRIIPARPFKAAKSTAGTMLELNPTDLHLGKLAWGAETGWENYDSKSAEAAMEDALASILARVSGYRFEYVSLVVGNDFYHSDTKQGTTTKGTPLDNDSRYHKTFLTGFRLLVRAIDRATANVAPVKVIVVPGNHDTLSAFHLGHALECYYHKTKHVSVDNAPTMRKYHQHGKVMLMFTHGNAGRLEKYPLLMAREQPQMWADTWFREAHTGDKHQTKTLEVNGVRVRILPALCAADAWHSDNHFVGQQRSTEAYIWHRQEGLVGTAVYTIPTPSAMSEGAA
jgi:hypothetical protein